MAKSVLKFFQAIPDAYYAWRKRNEKIDQLIQNHANTLVHIDKIQQQFSEVNEQVAELKSKIGSMIIRLDVVKRGTKIELFNTLHDWRELLVVKRGWATPEEKKEITQIYELYSGPELQGNGNGDRYYKEIIALPESKEELEAKKRNV